MAKEPDDKLQGQHDFNLDPLTEAPNAHPVGTDMGAAAGAVTGGAVAGAVSPLNDLLAHCHDGSYGFTDCAEHTKAAELRAMLVRHAEECRLAALELRAQIKKLGGEPDEGGTASGALHRGWIALRGTLTGYTDLQMLQECERAHDDILQGFGAALQTELPEELRPVLLELQRHVQRSHDEARAAREELENRPFLD